MPFTLEGTSVQVGGGGNGFCTASMVLGIVSLPFGCTAILPILAVIFGIIGYRQATRDNDLGGRRKAIAGMTCGVVGGLFILYMAMR
jgi:Na+/proline symporter